MQRARPALASTLVSIVLAGCGPAPELPDLATSHGDLAAIRESGTLRILIPTLNEEILPRRGSSLSPDQAMAKAFAERLGVEPEFIPVSRRSELLAHLESGHGDIVTAQLTVTPDREKRVRFSRPTAVVAEWLVGRRGDPHLPKEIEDLDGREVHVRPSSAFAETLARLSRTSGLEIPVVAVAEDVDTETIAYQVSRGERPLTVVDEDLLVAIEAYNEDLERLFVLAEGRQRAWAIRREAIELAAAVDAFIIEQYLTDHRTDDRSLGDLDAVRARGSLRVLTLNNPVNYFLYRGRLLGFDYEVAALAASRLGVRLEMVVPPSRDQVFDWLLDGRGDVIASTLTVTPERQEYLAFSRPYLFIRELVVQPASARVKRKDLSDLAGQSIHAWRSSSHYQTLVALRRRLGDLEIVPVPEDMEFEEILDRVGSGEYPLAVVDSHILEAELAFRDDVEVAFALADPDRFDREPEGPGAIERAVAFAIRPGNPELKSFLDAFVAEVKGSLEYNVLVKRYFGENRRLPRVKELRVGASGRLSPYDDLLRLYSKRYGLDWRLMAAQAYQESRFDPGAESWAGARGLFQLLPTTAREVGFEDLSDPESGIHAGVRYVHLLYERIDDRIPLKHRMRFALAAYNAGLGHVQDARRLAAEMGWDANKWFGHTEEAMLLLRHPRYYQHARFGYVRGFETVGYVSRIQNLYDHYVGLVPP